MPGRREAGVQARGRGPAERQGPGEKAGSFYALIGILQSEQGNNCDFAVATFIQEQWALKSTEAGNLIIFLTFSRIFYISFLGLQLLTHLTMMFKSISVGSHLAMVWASKANLSLAQILRLVSVTCVLG